MKRNCNAKEVFAFCEFCLDIQKENLKVLNEQKELEKYKDNEKKQKQIDHQINIVSEKIDYLENTQSIIFAVYDKFGMQLKFRKKDLDSLKKKFK